MKRVTGPHHRVCPTDTLLLLEKRDRRHTSSHSLDDDREQICQAEDP